MVKLIKCIVFFFALSGSSFSYDVGVYYYPGWTIDAWRVKGDPWMPIKNYPNREPMLGWYDEKNPDVSDRHFYWMNKFGVDYVIYDWYWHGGTEYLEHAIKSFKNSKNNYGLKFSILWANHSGYPKSISDFDRMVSYIVQNYLSDDRYYKINGQPVVYILSPKKFNDFAVSVGVSVSYLLNRAKSIALDGGMDGIYFIGGANALQDELDLVVNGGYSAISAYNYHRGFSGIRDGRKLSASYGELIDGYLESWIWIAKNSKIPYHVPVSAGWDSSPWRRNDNLIYHDGSYGNYIDFRRHLLEARNFMNKYKFKNVVICCWNEFGEGSYIEPTLVDEFKYLEAVNDVFWSMQ